MGGRGPMGERGIMRLVVCVCNVTIADMLAEGGFVVSACEFVLVKGRLGGVRTWHSVPASCCFFASQLWTERSCLWRSF